jgi:hypothetical protein
MTRRRRSPFHRISIAAQQGKGVRLSKEDVDYMIGDQNLQELCQYHASDCKTPHLDAQSCRCLGWSR